MRFTKMRRAVEVHIQSTLPGLVLDCSLPPGQLYSSLDCYRHLGELKTLSQRNISVKKRAERIQRGLIKNAHVRICEYDLPRRCAVRVTADLAEFFPCQRSRIPFFMGGGTKNNCGIPRTSRKAYFTCESPGSPMIFLTVEGPRCP